MKIKKLLFAASMLVVTGLLLIWLYPTVKCGQFWGRESYGWGGSSGRCIKAGCNVVKIKEVDDLKMVDDEGFYYLCMPK